MYDELDLDWIDCRRFVGFLFGFVLLFLQCGLGDGMTVDMVLMGVLGAPIPDRDIGDGFGAI